MQRTKSELRGAVVLASEARAELPLSAYDVLYFIVEIIITEMIQYNIYEYALLLQMDWNCGK